MVRAPSRRSVAAPVDRVFALTARMQRPPRRDPFFPTVRTPGGRRDVFAAHVDAELAPAACVPAQGSDGALVRTCSLRREIEHGALRLVEATTPTEPAVDVVT